MSTHFISIWWVGIFNLCNLNRQLSLCHLLLQCPTSKKGECRLTFNSSSAYPCSPAVRWQHRWSLKGMDRALSICIQLWELSGHQNGQLYNLHMVNFWDSIINLPKLSITHIWQVPHAFQCLLKHMHICASKHESCCKTLEFCSPWSFVQDL